VTQRWARAAVAAAAAYMATRSLGLLGLWAVYLDPLVGALLVSAALVYEAGRWERWLLARGVEKAVTASVAVMALLSGLGVATGFAVNGFVAGHVSPLRLAWVAGVLAASALAARLLGGARGAAAASLLATLGAVSAESLRILLLHPGVGDAAELLYRLVMGAAVGVAALDYGVLAGLVFGWLVFALPAYVVPLLPRLPSTALTMLMAGTGVVAAVYMHASRLEARGLLRGGLRGQLRGLATVLAVALATAVALKKGYLAAVVATGSMEPAIRPGDLVLIAPADPSSLRLGDVVAYVGLDGSLVVHRLVGVSGSGGKILLYAKGDANKATDPPFTPDRLVGRVVLRLPYLGLPQLLLAKLLGSVVAFPALLASLAALAAMLGSGTRRVASD